MTDFDAAQFRELCGRFATGVVIVTTLDSSGAAAGMTANSFTSVSLDPPLISLNIDRTAEFHRAIEAAATFTVNVLGADQEALSRRFAQAPGPERFSGIGYRRTETGRILLTGAIATIDCETFQRFPVGDHTVVIGRVVGGEAHDGRPLLYFRGGYHNLS
ncbi:MAG: flavin reductase family protein [Gemmatimonadales bacterium]|nr:flavin reductase family protein [Gemmatimonadales bacterium]